MNTIEIVNGDIYITCQEFGRCYMGSVVICSSGRYGYDGTDGDFIAMYEDLLMIAEKIKELNDSL